MVYASLAAFCVLINAASSPPADTEQRIDRTVEDASLQRAPQLNQLAWMVGEWAFDVVTIHPDGSEEVWLLDQRNRVQFERDNTWLRSDIIYPTQPLETQIQYLTFDLVDKKWVSIAFSNTGYRDIQSSTDDFTDGKLEFEAEICDLDIALDKCRGVIIKHSDTTFSTVSERYIDGAWQPFSRADYRKISNE